MDDWYYGVGDETRGPLKLETLIAIFAKVSTWQKVFVWRPGFRDWVAAGDVPELIKALAPPPLPVRQPPPRPVRVASKVEILEPLASETKATAKTNAAKLGTFMAGSAGLGLYLAYFAVGILQISAFVEGMHLYFKLGGFVSFIIFLIVYNLPFGVFALAFFTYYGARYGWRWEWWQALAMAAPGMCIWIVISSLGGATNLFQRRGRW